LDYRESGISCVFVWNVHLIETLDNDKTYLLQKHVNHFHNNCDFIENDISFVRRFSPTKKTYLGVTN